MAVEVLILWCSHSVGLFYVTGGCVDISGSVRGWMQTNAICVATCLQVFTHQLQCLQVWSCFDCFRFPLLQYPTSVWSIDGRWHDVIAWPARVKPPAGPLWTVTDDDRRPRPLLVWPPYTMCRRASSNEWQWIVWTLVVVVVVECTD